MVGLASSEGGGKNPSSIYFRGTNITGNRVLDQNYGGGVALMNNNAGGIISFEDCLIEDNHGLGEYGRAWDARLQRGRRCVCKYQRERASVRARRAGITKRSVIQAIAAHEKN